MKAASIIHLAIGVFIIPFLVSFPALPPLQAQTQDSTYLEPSEKYSREELTQMLAPIALYPDALLSQVLMASTYPIEVIEADRWIKRNPMLKGKALDDALLARHWDPSVKALCHFPPILALMSDQIAETTNIGNAFLGQEDEVMDMIQELRAKAYAQGNLTITSEQKVIVKKETIIIEPADPRVIYVPYYDPYYIYGPWWYPAYPPYYWGPSRVSIGVGISYWPGFYFGFAFGTWGYFDWHHHYIYINVQKRPRYVRYDRWRPKSGRWNHVPRHRRGVAYRDKSTARKYGQYPPRIREFRHVIRGFPERRDRDRRVDGRTRIERDTRRDDRTRIDRDRQERTRIAPDRQERQRIERDRRERVRIEPERQKRQRIDRDRQERKRIDWDRQRRERVERQRQERSRDTLFNRVEEGRRERESSRRGRFSRHGPGGDGRGGREDRGRNRR
jgi:hypothetical protein